MDRVVRAAAHAQQAWGLLPARDRGAKVRQFAALLRAHAEELASLDAVDAGFTLSVMRADVQAAAILLEIMADHALALGGATYPLSGNLHYSLNQPYGVVGRIIPFNHPLFFAAGKVAAPLVAGNAVVLNAPDQTPLSALRMAELAADVFGPDLCAAITGRGAVSGRALVRHPLVRRIGFIGAPDTGRLIQREAAEAGVKYCQPVPLGEPAQAADLRACVHPGDPRVGRIVAERHDTQSGPSAIRHDVRSDTDGATWPRPVIGRRTAQDGETAKDVRTGLAQEKAHPAGGIGCTRSGGGRRAH